MKTLQESVSLSVDSIKKGELRPQLFPLRHSSATLTAEMKLGSLIDHVAANAADMICSLLELAALPFELARNRLRDSKELAAENLVLRRQIAMLLERGVKPRRPTAGARIALAWLSRLCRSDAVVLFKPATLVRWHREGFRLFWRWKSRPGRPPIPEELQKLILQMASENQLWGEERIANELLLKLGIRVSPRTVRKYLPHRPKGRGKPEYGQKWSTFLRNHAKAIVACDFLTTVTARFQILYALVVMELGSRRILYTNVTANPTADWTLQQMREAFPWAHGYEWMIHDRAPCFTKFDAISAGFGLKVLKTPPRSPRANAFCERLNGTVRRECLDHLIPLSEEHLRRVLVEWTDHYNRGRPHSQLGPGLPVPSDSLPAQPQDHPHQCPSRANISRKPILGGLHHEYRLGVPPLSLASTPRM